MNLNDKQQEIKELEEYLNAHTSEHITGELKVKHDRWKELTQSNGKVYHG